MYYLCFEMGVGLKDKVHVITLLKSNIWTQKASADGAKEHFRSMLSI